MDWVAGGLDAGVAPSVRAGGGAAGAGQGGAVADPGADGQRVLPHAPQHRQPSPGIYFNSSRFISFQTRMSFQLIRTQCPAS